MNWQTNVGITALITALVLLVEHYFPWRLVLKRDLPRQAAYVLGVLAILLPFSCLLLLWIREWSAPFGYPLPAGVLLDPGEALRRVLVALWAVVLASGVSTLGAYLLDWLLERIALAGELAELLREVYGQARSSDAGE